jgi:hypothetical protein
MMKKTKLPSFVTVLILTLITVIMWVSFEVYRLFVKPVTPSVPESVSAPLTPTLDQATIDQVKTHLFLNDSEIPDVVIGAFTPLEGTPQPSPTPESSTEETSLQGGESPIQEVETATGSGEAI